MAECVWIVGFIVVLAITIASCPVREDKREDRTMERIDCVMVLSRLRPPLPSLKRKDYRPYVTSWVEGREMDEVAALCRFLGCDIGTLVTRIMDWQYSRARSDRDLARAMGKASTPGDAHES